MKRAAEILARSKAWAPQAGRMCACDSARLLCAPDVPILSVSWRRVAFALKPEPCLAGHVFGKLCGKRALGEGARTRKSNMTTDNVATRLGMEKTRNIRSRCWDGKHEETQGDSAQIRPNVNV